MIDFWSTYNRLRKTKYDALQFKKLKTCSVCSKEESPIINKYLNKYLCMDCWKKQQPNTESTVKLVKNVKKSFDLFD